MKSDVLYYLRSSIGEPVTDEQPKRYKDVEGLSGLGTEVCTPTTPLEVKVEPVGDYINEIKVEYYEAQEQFVFYFKLSSDTDTEI